MEEKEEEEEEKEKEVEEEDEAGAEEEEEGNKRSMCRMTQQLLCTRPYLLSLEDAHALAHFLHVDVGLGE